MCAPGKWFVEIMTIVPAIKQSHRDEISYMNAPEKIQVCNYRYCEIKSSRIPCCARSLGALSKCFG